MTGRRVDAHHHLWQTSVRRHAWLDGDDTAAIRRDFTPDDLRAAALGIDATVLVQVLPDFEESVEFLATAAAEPLIAGVVGWIDLTGSPSEDLERLRSAPGGELLAGIRHLVQAEPDPRWLEREDVLAGLAAVRDAGLVYDLLVLPHQLPAATAAVRALPELTFVLDHLAKPPIAAGQLEPWATGLATLAREPNVVAKLSGLVTEAGRPWRVEDLRPYAETALAAFGPDRLMLGSDWPVCLLAGTYAQVMDAADSLLDGLTPAERDAVRGQTASRVYGLAP
ncbi:amidohydrolase [Amycolatopsis mediterranei S699]|uniref:Amidohydrolase n=3 Tax=Amycolatopsis mediterranei TaxID=33910 RepID=A0A9R0NVZ8_AMYMS|nr:amidohydrolase family protein [Amycolatopsis mediterranei]ADJ44876.1 putative amidohydrolase [Amycolatopsis mediterranei U32]AEK41626.1 amidohydrolase [Amycolatopsis mediterranei S699]AFO76587.1 amidohydrolase [Amycolatopsis mediterranei S699]AGT83716.1 amidohydrolase [Amycolatopsis mediterranei RB]KDO07298.1 amidohydrolase [Amycolatopsis mediterranei]